MTYKTFSTMAYNATARSLRCDLAARRRKRHYGKILRMRPRVRDVLRHVQCSRCRQWRKAKCRTEHLCTPLDPAFQMWSCTDCNEPPMSACKFPIADAQALTIQRALITQERRSELRQSSERVPANMGVPSKESVGPVRQQHDDDVFCFETPNNQMFYKSLQLQDFQELSVCRNLQMNESDSVNAESEQCVGTLHHDFELLRRERFMLNKCRVSPVKANHGFAEMVTSSDWTAQRVMNLIDDTVRTNMANSTVLSHHNFADCQKKVDSILQLVRGLQLCSSAAASSDQSVDASISSSSPPKDQNAPRKPTPKLPRKPKDPKCPKKPMSSYFVFANEVRPLLRGANPAKSITEIAALTGVCAQCIFLSKLFQLCASLMCSGGKWREMSSHQKSPYVERAKMLKEQYDKEMMRYRGSPYAKKFAAVIEKWKDECTLRKKRATQAMKLNMKGEL